jgi:hypothetical protein
MSGGASWGREDLAASWTSAIVRFLPLGDSAARSAALRLSLRCIGSAEVADNIACHGHSPGPVDVVPSFPVSPAHGLQCRGALGAAGFGREAMQMLDGHALAISAIGGAWHS